MNNNPFTPEQLTALKNTFKPTKPIKKARPHRIKFMGEFVTLNSGKTVWKRIGDAKSALHHHFATQTYSHYDPKADQSIINQLLKQFFSHEGYPYQHTSKLTSLLEKAGVVEFVPVD